MSDSMQSKKIEQKNMIFEDISQIVFFLEI